MTLAPTVKPSQPSAPAGALRSVRTKHLAVWLLCLLAVGAGAQFRFLNLGLKLANCDEEHTRIQIEGPARLRELNHLYNNYIPAGALQDSGKVCPGSNIGQVYNSCCRRATFNPPLYFLLARLWAERFGTAICSLRCLSAVISLLEIPLWFLLGITLFQSAPTAAVITALAMISPYHLWLSQLARPYSLWTVFTLASSILLLRASKIGGSRGSANTVSWSGFLLTSCLGLYTHISALRVLLGHLIYGLVSKYGTGKFRLAPLLITGAAALLLFVPWLCEMNRQLSPNYREAWFVGQVQLPKLVSVWRNELVQLLFDRDSAHVTFNKGLVHNLFLALEALLALVFIRRAPKGSRIFLLSMAAVSFLTLSVPDLIWGGGRTNDNRYMMPVAVALQCIFGFAVSTIIGARDKILSVLGLFLLVALLAAGAVSDCDVSQTRCWWYTWGAKDLYTAEVINPCPTPIILGWMRQDCWTDELMSLSQTVRPDVILAISSHPDLMPIPKQYSDVFLLHPTPEQIAKMTREGMVVVRKDTNRTGLWKILQCRSQ